MDTNLRLITDNKIVIKASTLANNKSQNKVTNIKHGWHATKKGMFTTAGPPIQRQPSSNVASVICYTHRVDHPSDLFTLTIYFLLS